MPPSKQNSESPCGPINQPRTARVVIVVVVVVVIVIVEVVVVIVVVVILVVIVVVIIVIIAGSERMRRLTYWFLFVGFLLRRHLYVRFSSSSTTTKTYVLNVYVKETQRERPGVKRLVT